MPNYSGDPKKIVSSSYLFAEMQRLFDKVKGLLNAKSDKGHTHNSLVPIMTKTYTGIIAQENNFANGTYYFGTVMPDDYNTPWRIKYRITSNVEGTKDYSGLFIIEFYASQNKRIGYKIFNTHTSTGSRSLCNHVLYSATEAGIEAGYGHALGIGLRNSNNCTNSSYKRNFTIEVLEIENCSCDMLDSMTLFASLTGANATNYSGYTEYDGANNGLRETGDYNDYTRLLNPNARLYAGSNKIFPNTIIMEKEDGKFESLVLYSSTATTKSKNTSGFKLDRILYHCSGSTISANSLTSTWTIYEAYSDINFSYSSNCGTTLTAYKPIYLKGTIENDLFYLADVWHTQSLPTIDDGFAYIYLGDAWSSNKINLSTQHPIYVYKNGHVQNYVGNAETVNGHTVESDVPKNAKFTDTTYTTATPSKSGLMSYEDKIKLDTIETGANNYELPEASATEMGGIQLGYSQTGKNYPVQLEDGKAYVEVPWSWRGIQDNLTSTSTTDSLSANQGKVLKGLIDGKAPSGGSTSISKLANTITLGGGDAGTIHQKNGTYQQKINIVDNSTPNDAVFQFQQSTDTGANFTDLMTINDDGSVVADTFRGSLEGTALDSSMLNGMSTSHGTWGSIPYIREKDGVMEVGKYIDFHIDASASKDYDTRITANNSGLEITGTTKGQFAGTLAGTASNAIKDAKDQNIADTYVKDVKVEDNTLKMTNGSGTTVDVMDLYTVGTSSNLGLSKLYTETGTNTDGSMTQNAISNALKTKSNANHNHDSNYLSLANGGTVNGMTAFTQGTYVTRVNANTSTIGYLHLATLTIKSPYADSYIEMEVSKRNGYGQIYIKFANANSTNPPLEKFYYSSINNLKPVLVKTDAGIWDLYIKETETYDSVTVLNYYSNNKTDINVTWDSGETHTEDIGEDFIEATSVTLNQNINGTATTATKASKDSAGQQINSTYIKGLSVSGKTITYTKGDGTTGTITTQDTNTTYGTGTATTAGLTKLYTSTGSSTDGTMTRKAITDALATKSNVGHTHTADECGALDTALKGVANGVAELDENGKVPSSQLPSYVDDVVEGYLSSGKFYSDSEKTKLITGEDSKIYVDLTTNKTYRWSGSAYTEISASLALGETSSTAYRGDRGKIAYTHSQAAHAPSNAEKNTIVGIQKNGTDLAIDSSSRKVNITVPTKVSELENDSNFQSTVYTTGTPTEAGVTKLYTGKGTNTDGAMTQNAVTTELTSLGTALNDGLAKKSNVGHTHSKNEIMDLNQKLTNADLNSITEVGFYYADGSNTCTNKPSGIDAFGLEVIRSAEGWFTQKCYASNKQMKEFIRWYQGGSWTDWVDITVTADHTHEYLPLSGGTLTGALELSNNNYIQGTMGGSDYWRIKGGQTASDSGYLEIATADNGNEPIYVRQYTVGNSNPFNTLNRTATLLDASGNTSFPGKVSANSMQVTDKFIGNLQGNADTATKLKTARTIAIKGAVTGTATSFDGSQNIEIETTKVSADNISGTLNNTYLNIHPENANNTTIPFINNDLAFMLKRGGSTSFYTTTDTDYTEVSLTKSTTINADLSNAFDGSYTYTIFSISSMTDIVIVDLSLPETLAFNTSIYYESGAEFWSAKTVKILLYNSNDTEGNKYKLVFDGKSSYGHAKCIASYSYTKSSTQYYGFNRIRFVLTDFSNTSPRIAQLGAINYGSAGVRKTFMSRGIDDLLYRSLTPATNSEYNLGGSSNKWKNVYATTFNGALEGNAKTATSATKATQDSAGQQINTTYIKGLSVSGRKVTYTKGDGTTGSFNTQDTTYSAVSSSANGLMTPALLTKLNGIAAGAEVNVNADWNATSGDAMILNKPTIPEVIYETEPLDLDLLV